MKNILRTLRSLKKLQGLLISRIERQEMRLAEKAHALSANDVDVLNARIQEALCKLSDVNDRIMDIESDCLYVSYPIAGKHKGMLGMDRTTKMVYAFAA
jgi:hypothetical protein